MVTNLTVSILMYMEFPFVFGKVVTGPQFINRKKELAKLKANIDHGIQRKCPKTSNLNLS
jgi:hypothetical protein